MDNRRSVINFKGIIIPSDWDDKGNVTSILIAAYDEEEYHVTAPDVIERLKPFLRKEITVSGTLERIKGKTHIHISNVEKTT